MLRDRHAVTVSAASSVIRIALSDGQTRRRPSAAPRRQTDPYRGQYPTAAGARVHPCIDPLISAERAAAGRVSESDDCTAGGAGGGDGGGRRLAPLGAGRGGGSLAGKRDCPSTGPRSAAKPIAGSIPEDVRPVTGTYVRSSSVVAPGSDTLDDRLSAETRSTVGAVDRRSDGQNVSSGIAPSWPGRRRWRP